MRSHGSLDSFGTILTGLAKRLGLQSHLFELRLQQRWSEVVGEPVASHTWPVQIRFKKLYLLVRNSVWLQQLTFLKPTLIVKLNQQAGEDLVTDIAFRVGEIPIAAGAPARPAESPARPLPDHALTADVSSHISAIQNPDIRQRFTEVIGTYPSQDPAPPGGGPSRVP